MTAIRAAVAFMEREARERQAEGRKQVQKAITELVKRYRSDDPVQRAEQVRRFHAVLLPEVQERVLDKLTADSMYGSSTLKRKSTRALREIGQQAVTHLFDRHRRSKDAGHRLRLRELLAEVAPASAFPTIVLLTEAEFARG